MVRVGHQFPSPLMVLHSLYPQGGWVRWGVELQPMLGRIGCPKNDTLRTIDEGNSEKNMLVAVPGSDGYHILMIGNVKRCFT